MTLSLRALWGWLAVGCLVMMTGHHAVAAELPGFEDFRRVDRLRRLTGQLQTADLIAVTQIDQAGLLAVARERAGDWQVQWGAAELCTDLTRRQELLAAALALSRTNQTVLVRSANWLARQRQDQAALEQLALCRQADMDNLVPWLVEAWLRYQQHGVPGDPVAVPRGKLPPTATLWRDQVASAARAKIQVLELMGYSPYAARRLGFTPEAHATQMAHDLAQQPIAPAARLLMLSAARAMQDTPTFLLTELVGQSLERTTLKSADQTLAPAARFRIVELDQRRDEIREMLAVVERQAVEIATEAEMVKYFDEVLALGEEQAMRNLLARVRGQLAR